jgi:hypothetical protein
MKKLVVRNIAIYVVFLAVFMVIGIRLNGLEGYFDNVRFIRLLIASGLAIVSSYYWAKLEYEKQQRALFEEFLVQRIQSAKHISMADLEDLCKKE